MRQGDRSPRGFALCWLVALCHCAGLQSRPAASLAGREAQAFLHAWQSGDDAALRALLVEAPKDLEAQLRRFREDLGVVSSRFELLSRDEGVATFRAVHLLRGLGEWEVENALRLERTEGGVRVRWSPQLFHPEAREGDRFVRARTRPPRAPILDGRGAPLTLEGDVITVGLEPGRVQSRAEVSAALAAAGLGLDPARLEAAFAAAPDRFVPLIDLRPEKFEPLRAGLAPVRGIFFRRKRARLSPAEGFAAPTLGRVGEVTAELLARLGPTYQAGDAVGLSGLELAREQSLAGTPSGEVRLRGPGGERVLHRFEGREGGALQTTLLPEVQRAADAALEGVALPAALVALDRRSGAVLAVSNRPLGESLNRALTGRYPPGSTFKVVTAEALLASGLSVESPAACPATFAVGGKSFRNFEGEAFGATSLRLAFAHSCNTAFIALAQRLGRGALEEAAGRFGFGVEYRPGLPTPGASFPQPVDDAERAAAAIGQGRVLATPLHMASVAAAATTGKWRAPFLLQEASGGAEAPLTSGARESLQVMMRAVVTEGTARVYGSGVPGLVGKTGTAEFGQGVPLPTHAWFIGVRGDVAFAVLVEGGGAGGRVAAPIAARFAARLE